MDNRPEAEEVTAGLRTTAAKIRALAEAEYYQSEIQELLNVRYQVARKVLIDAGLSSRLRSRILVERDSILLDATPPGHEEASSEILLRGGFEFIGEWAAEPETESYLNVVAP